MGWEGGREGRGERGVRRTCCCWERGTFSLGLAGRPSV